jgi:hypothetical protein
MHDRSNTPYGRDFRQQMPLSDRIILGMIALTLLGAAACLCAHLTLGWSVAARLGC